MFQEKPDESCMKKTNKNKCSTKDTSKSSSEQFCITKHKRCRSICDTESSSLSKSDSCYALIKKVYKL